MGKPTDFTNTTYVEEEIGFHFLDHALFRQAFVHKSYVNETKADIKDNERLEFLGDSVLSLAVSQHLYDLFPDYTEGELTRLRSMLVRRETLARLARYLRLDEHLLLGRGEEESGGRKRQATLCATYEALLGAVYVDRGFDAAQDFVLKTLEGELNAAIAFNLDQDPKSRLQEYIQGLYNETPSFRNSFTEGPDHAKHYIMTVNMKAGAIGVGQGHSKKMATQKAAGVALFRLGQPAPEYEPDEPLESQYDLYDPGAV